MKYVALVYNNPGAFEALSQTERDELMSEADAYLKEFTESGELLGGGAALADPSTGRTVRVRNGIPAVTDGPFAEAKEQLAGYYLLDTESLERATEIARAHPARGRRPDDGGDRAGLPRPGGHDRPADQPRQAEHQGQRHPVQPPTGAGPRRSAAGRSARALLDLQRGLHGVNRP
jgi:hypothetical protein